MRKLLYALILSAGAFAFGSGTPANALTANSVAGMSDVAKPGSVAQNVHWYGYRSYCWEYPWRCRYRPYWGYRRHYYYPRWHRRHHYYRPYYRHHYRRYW